MKSTKPKQNPIDGLYILKVMEEFKDENGKLHQKVIWEKAHEDISLGSVAKPNKKIIGFEYKYTPPPANIGTFFDNLMK